MGLKWSCALSALAIGLSGCTSSGTEALKSQDMAAVNASIVDGKTTRDDILRIYGKPTQTTITSKQREIWVYSWSHSTPQPQSFIPYAGVFVAASDVQHKHLLIAFDSNNVVASHSVSEGSTTARRDFGSSSTSAPLAAPQPGSAAPVQK
jgi:outer membrane protein assembly factor BamE (lipoprotein component of BamABCDE complex)